MKLSGSRLRKRVLGIVAVSTIVLAACGGSDDAADTSSETTAATAEEVELSATEGGILAAVQ
ncbi:MAG: hypothetical protein RLZZ327_765, partial [Actinomycetota bacterium]